MPESGLTREQRLTTEALARIDKNTSARFEEICGTVADTFPDVVFKEFSDLCLEIAGAGWKSYESVGLLLELARETASGERLLEVARFGHRLSGYSHEPAYRYLSLVRSVGIDTPIDDIERAGRQLQARFQHATGLISGYFGAASVVCSARSGQSSAWVAVVDAFYDASRDSLVKLFDLSSDSATADVSWETVAGFHPASPDAVLIYLANFGLLAARFKGESRLRLEAVLQEHAAGDLQGLIQSWLALELDEDTLMVMMGLAEVVNHVDVLKAMLAQAHQYPLDEPELMTTWLTRGMLSTADNPLAFEAFVRLESAQSRDLMAALQGQVSLSEHKRMFDLIAEAMTASPVNIESMEDSGGPLAATTPALPDHDGRTIHLPAEVSFHDSREDNFDFYKVSLFHQLGYAEFGLFQSIADVQLELAAYQDASLAERIFMIVEDARIDWQLTRLLPGLKAQVSRQKHLAVQLRVDQPLTRRARLLEAMLRMSLDDDPVEPDDNLQAEIEVIRAALAGLGRASAAVSDSLHVTAVVYELLRSPGKTSREMDPAAQQAALAELPEPIAYRGEMDMARVESTLKIDALVNELQDAVSEPDMGAPQSSPDSDQQQVDLGNLTSGDVGEGVSMMLTELTQALDQAPDAMPESGGEGLSGLLAGLSASTREASRHLYDEWDCEINDYRPRWCTLYEHRTMDVDEDYFHRILREHEDLGRRIRQQLGRVKPEMLRKVKGVVEGEELDLERSISWVVDRRAGLTPDDNIYVQRQRRDRDVSTLFLLDMSASTDDIVPDPGAPALEVPDLDDDEYLVEFFRERAALEAKSRRIIDLEKESVVLLAEALERLGDAYSVCGFSGYGREQVDYYLCKDFDESLDARSRARIGGIKPCRSTRMGPPIRHATRRLLETGSRVKALIIIYDGYPQDHDYGTDRNSRQYGLMDTMKALSEARLQGVLSYCLTVDPSGHDYLRAMCPDSQYMVIQDIEQLPEELSRVYRSLTG